MANSAVHTYGALQDEWEFAMLLHFVQQHRPRTIVEIGSFGGGSLSAWTKLAPKVVAVTLGEMPLDAHGATVVYGDSTSGNTQQKVWDAVEGQADFVFVDGGHDFNTAYSDTLFAITLCAKTMGIVGIHDINLYHRYPDLRGPRDVFQEFRKMHPAVEIARVVKEDPGCGLLWLK